ncbi:MAG: glycosyltransferase family 4 protein [Bacteroidales bacterium]|nr:glycosyltransferase family 4 protein [Bacteroidales bacterium]
MIAKKKLFFVTTIAGSLNFFKGQYQLLLSDFDITAIASDKKRLKEVGEENHIKIHHISMEREISIFKDFYCLICFIFYFIRQRPYIVHGNTPKGSLLSMIAAWITRVPVRIYMCHGLRYQGCYGLKRKLLMFMERISCSCATEIICVSHGIKEVLIEDRITNKEPIVIWNGSVQGIDMGKFNPDNITDKQGLKGKYGIEDDDFVLTFVGRIVKDKGINELVEAFEYLSLKYSDIKLLLIGWNEDKGNPVSDKTKEIIDNNKNIIATGPQSNIVPFLSITDLFVFPSYREGFGLSLMEAGAMNVPSIASNIPGCNEVIIDGLTGLLIKPRSTSAIIESIEKLYNDRELLDYLKSNCRKSIIERYEQNQLWQHYREYYLKK